MSNLCAILVGFIILEHLLLALLLLGFVRVSITPRVQARSPEARGSFFKTLGWSMVWLLLGAGILAFLALAFIMVTSQ